MNIQLDQHKVELKPVYGGFDVISHATCTTTDDHSNVEVYEVRVTRNPLTGSLIRVVCDKREENTTTENTLTCEAVQDLVYDEIS